MTTPDNVKVYELTDIDKLILGEGNKMKTYVYRGLITSYSDIYFIYISDSVLYSAAFYKNDELWSVTYKTYIITREGAQSISDIVQIAKSLSYSLLNTRLVFAEENVPIDLHRYDITNIQLFKLIYNKNYYGKDEDGYYDESYDTTDDDVEEYNDHDVRDKDNNRYTRYLYCKQAYRKYRYITIKDVYTEMSHIEDFQHELNKIYKLANSFTSRDVIRICIENDRAMRQMCSIQNRIDSLNYKVDVSNAEIDQNVRSVTIRKSSVVIDE